MIRKLLAWLQRNERHLGALVFVFGFVTDILTFTLLDVSIVNLIFAAYIGIAAVLALLAHFVTVRARVGAFATALPTLCSLAIQYLIGNILSGVLIFYTKSSFIFASWPFLILLALVFIGNEYFRKYRDHLTFQSVLLFFGLYAYSIFALPLYVNRLGPDVFLLSTGGTIALFSLFLVVLWRAGRERFAKSFFKTVFGSLGIVGVMVGSYFSGLIPPIPLTLPHVGIYHSVSRDGSDYVLTGEEKLPWWNFWETETVHVSASSDLYAFSAVSAPVQFSTSIVHVWQRYSEAGSAWRTEARIAFPISGGRSEGYRGYSQKSSLTPGRWRVSIETPSGQVIGRTEFVIERGVPELTTSTR